MAQQVRIELTAEDKQSAVFQRATKAHQDYLKSYESIAQFTARQKSEADGLAASQQKLAETTDTVTRANRSSAESTNAVAKSNQSLFTTFTAANLAAEGIMRGFGLIKGQITESIQAARDYNSAMTGLSAATASYGMSADVAKNQALALSSDGILPITNSAKALQNLMAGGLGLEQSTELIQTFMDRAAFGRNRTIDFGTAIENLTQAFRTEQSELSDACLTYDTLVMTNQGPMMIGDIVTKKIFPKVLSFDIIDNEIRSRKIINHFDNGEKRSIRVTLESGRVIEGSYDHKLYRSDGTKVEFQDLCLNDLVISSTLKPENVKHVASSITPGHQPKNGVSPALTNPSSYPLNSLVENVSTGSSTPDGEVDYHNSAHQSASQTFSNKPCLEKATHTGKGGPSQKGSAQSVGKLSPNTKTIDVKTNTVVERAPIRDIRSECLDQDPGTTKAMMPPGTGEKSSMLQGRLPDGGSPSSSGMVIPASPADTTPAIQSTPTTSKKQLSTQSATSTSTTESPSVSSATDFSMDGLAGTQKTKFDNGSDSNSNDSLVKEIDQPDIGISKTTSGTSFQRLNSNSDGYPGQPTSMPTSVALPSISSETGKPSAVSTNDLDWNTLPHALVVQHDRVVSVDEIGRRHTYNITVEGEHNYFLGDSLENLTLTANSGMTENYSQILEVGANQLGKNVEALTAAERAQAKFIGIQQISAAQAGNYALYLQTDAAAQDRLNYTIEESQRLLGTALTPALANVQQGFGSFIQSLGITDSNMQNVQGSFVTLASVAQMAGAIVVGVAQTAVGAVQSVGSLSFKPLEQALSASGDRMVDVSVRWQESINKIATGSADTMIDESERGAAGVVDGSAKATREMLKSIDEANRQFARSQEQRLEQFQQSLTDMIISHRDKSLSIKADLTAEDAAYAQSAKNREQDYQDEISTLEERHADKVKDITKEISEERESGLMVDGVLYREANQEKIADLEEQLREETSKHEEALNKRKAEYQADVAEDKSRHDEKRTQLETELAAELEILNTHRTDVAAVGDAQKEDDITRLKNQYSQASAEATRNHQEQLVKIRERGTEQGATFGNALADGSKPGIDQTKANVDNVFNQIRTSASQSGKDTGTHWWTGFKDTIASWFQGLPGLITEWINNGVAGINARVRTMFAGPLSGVVGGLMDAMIGRRAAGGPVSAGQPYVVGEREAEVFVPDQNGQILNQNQLRSALSGNQGSAGRVNNINIGTVINQSNMDPDAFFKAIAWEMR